MRLFLVASAIVLASSEISFDLTVNPDDGSPSYNSVVTVADHEDAAEAAARFCKAHDITDNQQEIENHIHTLRGTPASVLAVPGLLASKEFWMRLGNSHVGREGACSLARVDELMLRKANTQVRTNGYAELPSIVEGDAPNRFYETTKALVKRGWHPAFAFLFDDMWYLSCGMAPLLKELFGSEEYKRTPTLHAHTVVPPGRARPTGHKDGIPEDYTVWMPIHKAKADSGGFYCVPAQDDPLFLNNEVNGPFSRASSAGKKGQPLQNKNVFDVDVTKVRAVPVEQGQYIVHSNSLFKWQGAVEADYKDLHTFSVGFEYTLSKEDFNMDMSHIPSFDERLKLLFANLHPDRATLSKDMQDIMSLMEKGATATGEDGSA